MMSAEIIGTEDSLVTAEVTGHLSFDEWSAVRKAMEQVVQERGKVSLLVFASGFQGWVSGDDWDDLTFFQKNDRHMEKTAIVGEKKWEESMLLFAGKGFRHCQVEFFTPDQADAARAWVTAPAQ